jgi:hypothetical protein
MITAEEARALYTQVEKETKENEIEESTTPDFYNSIVVPEQVKIILDKIKKDLLPLAAIGDTSLEYTVYEDVNDKERVITRLVLLALREKGFMEHSSRFPTRKFNDGCHKPITDHYVVLQIDWKKREEPGALAS